MPFTLRSILLLLLFVLPLTGCFYSRELAHTRRDIERAYDVDFDHAVTVSLGPASLRTLSWLAGLVPEEEAQMAQAYLRDVRRVKVGVYQVDQPMNVDRLDLPALERFKRDRWEVAVRVREPDAAEMVWVLYREDRAAIRDLYVLVLTDEELVMARLSGRLDRLFARIMEDHLDLSTIADW